MRIPHAEEASVVAKIQLSGTEMCETMFVERGVTKTYIPHAAEILAVSIKDDE